MKKYGRMRFALTILAMLAIWLPGSLALAAGPPEVLLSDGFDHVGTLDPQKWEMTYGAPPSCSGGNIINAPSHNWNSKQRFSGPVSVEFSGVYLEEMPRSGANTLALSPGGWGPDLVAWVFDGSMKPWKLLVPLRVSGNVDGWEEGYDKAIDLSAISDVTKKENAINLRIDWWPGKAAHYYLNGKLVAEFSTNIPGVSLPVGVRDETVGYRIRGINVIKVTQSAEEVLADIGAAPMSAATLEPIRIARPMEWQIAQRDENQMGTISIAGTCSMAGEKVEAQLAPMPGASGRETGWQKLTSGALPGEFSGDVRALAGGWYELQIRVIRGNKTVGEAKLAHIGVGEIFVIAGQSNAANHGADRCKAEEERAVAYGKGKWQPAADPMPGATGLGGSCWCPFADMLVRSLDVPVGIASVAVSGSPMSSWFPEGKNYPRLKKVLQDMRPNGVRAVLWHQGEADNRKHVTADTYYNGMKKIIETTSKDAGYPVQWFVARASFVPVRYQTPPVLSPSVRQAQERLWKDGIAFQGPDTDDLVGSKYRGSDEIHMGRYGLIAHGERWFAMVWGQTFARQPFPRIQGVIVGIIPEEEAAEASRHSRTDKMSLQ